MRRKSIIAVLLVVAVTVCFSFGGNVENVDAAAKGKKIKTPAKVNGLNIISRHKTVASIGWKKVNKSSGYKVYLSSKSAKKGYKVAKTINKNKTVRVTLKKLRANKSYYVKVRAFVKYKQRIQKYYNAKKKKWQAKKPKGKAWTGKKKKIKVTKYRYGKYSKVLKVEVYKSGKDYKTPVEVETPKNETESTYKTYTIKGPNTMYRGQEATFVVDAPINSVKELEWYVTPKEFIKSKDGLSITIKVPENTFSKKFYIQLANVDGSKHVWGSNLHEVKLALDPNLSGTVVAGTDDGFGIYSSGVPEPDGKVDITYEFIEKGGSNWTKDNYKINVTEVTPKAYKELYRQLGYSDNMTYSVEYKDKLVEYKEADEYGRLYYTGEAQPCTVVTVTIHANAARVFRLTEASGKGIYKIYTDGESGNSEVSKAYSKVYVAPRYSDNDNNTAEFYHNLYDKARKRLEEKLWTDNMTNPQKLSVISAYINATTHYPGTEATSKEKNGAYWAEHAIDGETLFYDEFNMPVLNKAMKLHGGITTCVAQSIIVDVAADLNLPYLYDKAQDKVLDGEGVWTGMGSYSSNPESPGHRTCYYKDAAGNLYAYDVQGLFSPCSEHNCKAIIVPLD